MTAFSFEAAFDLSGQVALVTGGASGIGHAIATALAGRGARLVLVDRATNVAEVAAALPGAGHAGVLLDLSGFAGIEPAIARIVSEAGRIDILVNNAGIVRLGAAEEASEADWDLTMAVNLKAPFLVAQAVGRRMIAQGCGRIVNIASQAALVALHGHVAYATSKAAIIGMTKVMAYEWGPKGVTVNSVSPTVVNTELGRLAWAGDVGTAFRAKIPTGRFAEPDEIAIAVLYLASNAAGMVNGENLVVDGGYTIQ